MICEWFAAYSTLRVNPDLYSFVVIVNSNYQLPGYIGYHVGVVNLQNWKVFHDNNEYLSLHRKGFVCL